MIEILKTQPLSVLSAILLVSIIVSEVFDLPPSTYRAAALLRIDNLPPSASDVTCWSEGFEHDFTQCVGRASIEDMQRFMDGWVFSPVERPKRVAPQHCADIPTQSVGATHCYQYDAPRRKFGPSAYVAFSYNETTGWFYASTFNP